MSELKISEVSTPTLKIPSVLVGLGNPGAKYAHTRHNIGFDVIDRLAQRWQIQLCQKRQFQGEFGEGQAGRGKRVRLLKPQTYMNQSGQATRAVLDWFKLSPLCVLVIYDDLDLPMGKLRLRLAGSAGGHNGMRSMIAHLGTQEFPRLRIGIGSPQPPEMTPEMGASKDTISYVLGRFTPAETQQLAAVLDLAVDAIEVSLQAGVEQSMNLYNGRSASGS